MVGVRNDTSKDRYGNNQLAEGLLCPWCCSVWFSTIVCILSLALGIVGGREAVLYILAASTGTILIDEVIGWLERQQ